MKFEMHHDDGIVVIRWRGDLDPSFVAHATARIDASISSGSRFFLFEVNEVTCLDASALGLLLKTQKRLEGRGGAMLLVRPSRFVAETLSVLGLEKVFVVFDTIPEAVDHLRGTTGGGEIGRQRTAPVLFRRADLPWDPYQVARLLAVLDHGLRLGYEGSTADPQKTVEGLHEEPELKLCIRAAGEDRRLELRGRVVAVRDVPASDRRGAAVEFTVRCDDPPGGTWPPPGLSGPTGPANVGPTRQPKPPEDEGRATPDSEADA